VFLPFVTTHTDSSLLSKTSQTVQHALDNYGYCDFQSSWVFLVTWHMVAVNSSDTQVSLHVDVYTNDKLYCTCNTCIRLCSNLCREQRRATSRPYWIAFYGCVRPKSLERYGKFFTHDSTYRYHRGIRLWVSLSVHLQFCQNDARNRITKTSLSPATMTSFSWQK